MSRTLRIFAYTFIAAHVAVPAVLALTMSGPLFVNDYSLMIYQQHRAVEFFGAFQNLWGYDPFFFAGYPLNFTWNSNLDLQFLSVIFHPLPEYIVLLGATFLSVAIAPFCFRAGLRNFGLRGGILDASTILMLAYWWSGLPAVFMLIGMPSAMFVFHLSFYTVSLFYRFFSEEEYAAFLPQLYIFATLCFIAHKTALVTVCVPAALMFFIFIRRVGTRRIAHLAGISAIVIAVNSFWLIPFIDLVRFKVDLAEAPHGLWYDPLRILKDYFTFSKVMGHKIVGPRGEGAVLVFTNTILRDLLLFAGIYGIVRLKRDGRRALSAFLACFTVLFLAEIYFGSFWYPTALLNPTRYVGYLDFFLAVPAAIGLRSLWKKVSARPDRAALATRITRPGLAVLLAAAILPYIFFSQTLDKRLDADTVALADYLNETVSPNGRVMIEDSGWNDRDGGPPRYGESQFPSLLPDITGTEYIGGPYPYVFLQHHYADFHDGKFLGRPLEEFGRAELTAGLNRYHIRWIVCWSSECRIRFSGAPESFRELENAGRFVVYERKYFEYDPFIRGRGYVMADHRGIRCYRVRPDKGEAVLKYHAFEGLGVRGGGTPGAAPGGEDPVGFISVKSPGSYLEIINEYW